MSGSTKARGRDDNPAPFSCPKSVRTGTFSQFQVHLWTLTHYPRYCAVRTLRMSLLTHYGAYDGAWLMQQDFPHTRYVVDGLITEGLTYIIDAKKIGTSVIVTVFALEVTLD